MPSDFVKDLVQHKQWVAQYMQAVASELFERTAVHDNSKFDPWEFDIYEQVFPELKKYSYGSEELKATYETLGPALKHHLMVNRHHPEYFENGVNGMNLIDLIEMVCDWCAASKRSQTGIDKGLQINKERYGIDEQVFIILKNTVDMLTRDEREV